MPAMPTIRLGFSPPPTPQGHSFSRSRYRSIPPSATARALLCAPSYCPQHFMPVEKHLGVSGEAVAKAKVRVRER